MKPILFNTEMVRAILDGRKTVTRRVVKPQPDQMAHFVTDNLLPETKEHGAGGVYLFSDSTVTHAPYQPGDILYVRETWAELETVHGVPYWAYKANDQTLHHSSGENFERWHPSIHMPKEAARIFLRVKDVRIEELQWCGCLEAKEEGCSCCSQFIRLWNNTIKKSDLDRYGWNANPWVWVIEFERINREDVQHD